MEVDAQFWDNIAERYARKPVEDVSAYERKLEITKTRLRPQDVILDLGCGTGSLALELAPRVQRVHAVDVSGEMIKIGQRKASTQRIENVTFHQSSVQSLPHFEPASFDVVCAYNILLTEFRDAGFVDATPHEVGAKKTVAFVVATKPE